MPPQDITPQDLLVQTAAQLFLLRPDLTTPAQALAAAQTHLAKNTDDASIAAAAHYHTLSPEALRSLNHQVSHWSTATFLNYIITMNKTNPSPTS